MIPDKILKLAQLFEQKVKKASIRGNMAKRIFFSLLSHLTPQGESARAYYTHGAMDVKALRQMISGAKELIDYGIKACLEELEIYDDKTGNMLVNNIHESYNSGDVKNTLNGLIQIFAREDWDASFGGENWKKIANVLIQIHNSLEVAKKARSDYDLDGEVKALMEMTSYMNVLDGLVHNTGSIMDKMLRLETNLGKDPLDFDLERDNKFYEERNKIIRLMDSKELEDPDDVLEEIFPTLEKETDASLTMKDWFSAARRRRHSYNKSEQDRESALTRIRKKKEYIEYFQFNKIKKLQEMIRTWGSKPDSEIMKLVVKYSSLFSSVYSLARMLPDKEYYDSIPLELRSSISKRIPIIEKLTSAITSSESEQQKRLANYSLRQVTQAVWETEYLIDDLEKITHYI